MSLCRKATLTLALLATTASTLCIYPHQLAYFNELAGGPENGHEHLLHSNLDWGQDLLYLRDWAEDHMYARPLRVTWEQMYDVSMIGVDCVSRFEDVSTGRPPRWHAISVSELQKWGILGDVSGDRHPKYDDMGRAIMGKNPVERVGMSLYVFEARAWNESE